MVKHLTPLVSKAVFLENTSSMDSCVEFFNLFLKSF